MFVSALAVFAHEADSMAVINHYKCAVFIREIADCGQVGNETVHGENAVGCNNFDSAILCCFKLSLKVFHVVVLIAESLCFAKANAVDDACMVQLIGNDRVFRTEKSLKQTAVCIEAGSVQNAVIHAEKICDFAFELLVDQLSAANETYGGETEAPLIIAFLCCCDNLGIVGKAEVVVCAHVENALCNGSVDASLLRGCDYAFILVGARFFDGIKFAAKDFVCFFHFFTSEKSVKT